MTTRKGSIPWPTADSRRKAKRAEIVNDHRRNVDIKAVVAAVQQAPVQEQKRRMKRRVPQGTVSTELSPAKPPAMKRAKFSILADITNTKSPSKSPINDGDKKPAAKKASPPRSPINDGDKKPAAKKSPLEKILECQADSRFSLPGSTRRHSINDVPLTVAAVAGPESLALIQSLKERQVNEEKIKVARAIQQACEKDGSVEEARRFREEEVSLSGGVSDEDDADFGAGYFSDDNDNDIVVDAQINAEMPVQQAVQPRRRHRGVRMLAVSA